MKTAFFHALKLVVLPNGSDKKPSALHGLLSSAKLLYVAGTK